MYNWLLLNILCTACEWSCGDMESFLCECSKMSELHHPNVLGLVGICFEDNTPYMLLPYMTNGDLKEFLLSKRVSDEDVTVYPEVIYYIMLVGWNICVLYIIGAKWRCISWNDFGHCKRNGVYSYSSLHS